MRTIFKLFVNKTNTVVLDENKWEEMVVADGKKAKK